MFFWFWFIYFFLSIPGKGHDVFHCYPADCADEFWGVAAGHPAPLRATPLGTGQEHLLQTLLHALRGGLRRRD